MAVPSEYLNRELSLLSFHRRVLAQAEDLSLPLLERFRFLCIAASNLDEFFEVRVAGQKKQLEADALSTGPDGMSPRAVLDHIAVHAHDMVADSQRILLEDLIPKLNQQGIFIKRSIEWTDRDRSYLQRFFRDDVLPLLSPLRLDPSHPFPRVLNKCLHILVSLSGDDAFGATEGLAVVPAPRVLPRLIRLPSDDGTFVFAYLASVIKAFSPELFPGMTINGCWPFRVTRNSDLELQEESDLMQAVASELPSRRFGDEVRLEVDHRCSENALQILLQQFGLGEADVYRMKGPVNLQRLSQLIDAVDRPDLKHPPFTPCNPVPATDTHLFDFIRRHDILLHHPYQSFLPVVDFVNTASEDSKTLAIKQTLYRTDSDSALVEGLVRAAQNGKEVTVLVELLARFDEAANIKVAERLQDAGAQVVYGVVGLKTHAKMLMIVRKEDDGIRRYVHLGTGNYNAKTARLYTDYGLITADSAIGRDVQALFLELTSFGKEPRLEKVIQAPFRLHPFLLQRIRREAENALAGKASGIRAKMNALIEPKVIEALYEASQAGVSIELLVRGACCLRPGLPGRSDNIKVRSIVGRFLEHSRVFTFSNEGSTEVYLASADWMDRNLFRRVETCFPVEDKALRERILGELDLQFRDERQAWILDSAGRYRRKADGGFSSQESLLESQAEGPFFGAPRND